MADITVALPKDTGNRYFFGPGRWLWSGTRIGSTDYASGDVRLVASDGTTPLITTNGLYVQGPVAHDGAAAGNPLVVGGVASAAAPTNVSADGDAVRLWVFRNGAISANLTAAGALIGGDATNGLDVDVTRMAALVAGSAVVGKVGIDQTTPGTTDSVSVATGQGAGATIGTTSGAAVTTDATGTVQQYLRGLVTQIGAVTASPVSNTLADRLKSLLTGIVLAAGTNAIGKLAANSGVDIGDVDVTSLPYTSAVTMVHTTATATTSTGAMLASNGSRKYALLVNDGSVDVYLKLNASAVANQGIRLSANGGSYEMSAAFGNLDTRAINGITVSGSAVVLVTEG